MTASMADRRRSSDSSDAARGFCVTYLVVIIDWATRKVLVWREADFCAEALNEALIRFGPPDIMNTDQGSQFTSWAWSDRLGKPAWKISMDGKGCFLDNIFVERLWRSLKYEASICMLGPAEARHEPASVGGSNSTTNSGPIPLLADERPMLFTGLGTIRSTRLAGTICSLNEPQTCPANGECGIRRT